MPTIFPLWFPAYHPAAACSAGVSAWGEPRQGMVRLLEVFGCQEEQAAYEEDRPHVDLPVATLCQWYRETWHPEDPAFRMAFNKSEWGALSAFAVLVQQQVSSLPEGIHMLRSWLAQPGGQELMARARELMALLQPPAPRRLGVFAASGSSFGHIPGEK